LNWRKNLAVLWCAVILSSASYTIVVPFLPLYLFDLGVTPDTVNLWSGLVFSVSFLFSTVLQPFWGRLADKAGKRRMVVRSGFSLAVVYFLLALVRTPGELFVVRALQGIAAGFWPAAMAIVATSAPADKLGFSLGVMQTAQLTGTILGPLLGGVLSHLLGIRVSFAAAAGLIFLATAAVRFFVVEPAPAARPRIGSVRDDLRAVWANRTLLKMLVLLAVVQMSVMILQPFITLYVAELQGRLAGAGLTSGVIFSLAGIAGAIASPLWGRVGQKIGFSRVLIAAFAGAGLGNLCQYFAGNLWQFGALQFVFGLFFAGAMLSINALVVKYTDETFRGRAFGATMSANQLGAMIGPLLGGLAAALVGVKMIFVGTGGLLLTVAVIVAARRRAIFPAAGRTCGR